MDQPYQKDFTIKSQERDEALNTLTAELANLTANIAKETETVLKYLTEAKQQVLQVGADNVMEAEAAAIAAKKTGTGAEEAEAEAQIAKEIAVTVEALMSTTMQAVEASEDAAHEAAEAAKALTGADTRLKE